MAQTAPLPGSAVRAATSPTGPDRRGDEGAGRRKHLGVAITKQALSTCCPYRAARGCGSTEPCSSGRWTLFSPRLLSLRTPISTGMPMLIFGTCQCAPVGHGVNHVHWEKALSIDSNGLSGRISKDRTRRRISTLLSVGGRLIRGPIVTEFYPLRYDPHHVFRGVAVDFYPVGMGRNLPVGRRYNAPWIARAAPAAFPPGRLV